MKYSMECSCGHVMEVEAGSREEAVEQLKAMMTPDAIADHMAEMHDPDEPIPTQEEVHADIEARMEPHATPV